MRFALLVLVPSIVLADRPRTAAPFGDATLRFSGGTKPANARIALERDGKEVWARDGLAAIAGGRKLPDWIARCDVYGFAGSPQPLGKRAGARLDMLCIRSGDHQIVRELSILVDTVEPYHVLWMGEADVVEHAGDACVRESLVTFDVDAAGKLVATTRLSARGTGDTCAPVTTSKRVLAL